MLKKLLIANPTIGADIETFLKDINSNEIVSAEGIIKGTKDVPFKFEKDNDYFGTSLDNVMAEFCIPPATTSDDFYNNIQHALGYIKSVLPEGMDVLSIPSAYLNPKYLKTENAQIFGCDPDFNAWLFGQMNPKPDGGVSNLRSCGGHIHVGYTNPDDIVSLRLIMAMDIFLGLPSIIQEPDNERKRLYGKAGAFRYKPYGIEYRTISNYYADSEQLTKWVFNNTHAAIEFVNGNNFINDQEAEAIQAAINHNDKSLAQTMCNYFNVKLAA